ncbi:hypothetical protein SLEP1_g56530 [Rubroshorea leprosula]|uniref:Uncharacterized protein n=1 Tax=Rubroshorea leprosula TaxID=152421 RepID=A0AAV5MJU3_9ROSI|nr:hypothetical protein SLEP1_g56530 [Rubroshorea leprosula]
MANRAASAESRANKLANKVYELKEELEKAQAKKESGIQQKVTKANQNLARAKEGLSKARSSHQCSISIARAQGAEWLVGSDMFPNVVAVAFLNTTMEIYNEIRGKVLWHWPDLPIGELAFFEGKEMDKQVLEEGEDLEGLPRFDSLEDEAPKVEAKPSSTPPFSQPIPEPACTSPTHSFPARTFLAVVEASVPVDLTDD